MSAGIRTIGLDKAVAELNTMIAAIPFVAKRGMIAGALYILAESNRLVPVDEGNLRASGFVIWEGGGKGKNPGWKNKSGNVNTAELQVVHKQAIGEAQTKASASSFLNPIVAFGYGAFYALIVHEDMQASHNKGKTAKFLQRAIKEKSNKILKLIREEEID